MEPFAVILAAMLAQTDAAIPAPPRPLAKPVRIDADRDGKVTRQEWMERFDRLDTDRDGMLTREERQAGRPRRPDRRGAHPRPPIGADGPMRAASRAEYLSRAGERFDRIDTNRDGRIDAAEIQAARACGRRCAER